MVMIFCNKLLSEIKCNQCRFKYYSLAVSPPQKSRIDISEGIMAVWFGTINIFPFTTHLHSTRTFVQNPINVSSTASAYSSSLNSFGGFFSCTPTGLKWKIIFYWCLWSIDQFVFFYSSSSMMNPMNADKHLAFGWQRLSNVINV